MYVSKLCHFITSSVCLKDQLQSLQYAYSQIPTRIALHGNEKMNLFSQEESNFHLSEKFVSSIELIPAKK